MAHAAIAEEATLLIYLENPQNDRLSEYLKHADDATRKLKQENGVPHALWRWIEGLRKRRSERAEDRIWKRTAEELIRRAPHLPHPRPRSLPRLPALRISGAARIVGATLALCTALPVMAFIAPAQTDAAVAGLVRVVAPSTDEMWARTVTRLDCALHVPVQGADGRIAAWLRTAPDCSDPGAAPEAGETATPSLVTAEIDPAQIARFGPVIMVVEGYHAGPGTILSTDIRGLLRAIRSIVTGGRRIGGSTGMLSGFEVLDDAQAKTLTVTDKLGYMMQVMRLAAGPLRDTAARNRFVALTMPAALHRGGPRSGLAVAGGMLPKAVFGKEDFADLDLAELCILVSGYKRPILLPAIGAGMQTQRRAEKRFEDVRRRADERCIGKLEQDGRISPAEASAARKALAALVLPVAERRGAPGLQGARSLIVEALALEPGGEADEPLHATIDPAAQALLSRAVARLDRRIDASGEGVACLIDCDRQTRRADVLAIAMRLGTAADRIVAAYQNRHGLWHGPTRAAPDGGLERSTPHRALASIMKAMIAPVLVAHDIDTVCRRSWDGLQDFDGDTGTDDCTAADGHLSLPEVLARSSNLGIAEAVRIVGVRAVTDWIERLGGAPTEARPSRRAIATGTAPPLSPEYAMRALSAMARGIEGEIATAQTPRILSGGGDSVALPPKMIAGTRRGALATALAAPIADPSGTLAALAPALAARGCDAGSSWGKTGTSETADPTGRGVRDRLVMLHAVCRGVPYGVFAMIGSPEINAPLRGITSAHVRTLALAALDAAMAADIHTTQGGQQDD